MLRWLLRIFSFYGRARRREYWPTVVIANAAMVLPIWISEAVTDSGRSMGLTAYLALLATMIAGFWANMAISVRRLHDRGASGFWLLLIYGSTAALAMAITRVDQTDAVEGWLALGFLLSFMIGLVVLGGLPGSKGLNRFGGEATPEKVAETFD